MASGHSAQEIWFRTYFWVAWLWSIAQVFQNCSCLLPVAASVSFVLTSLVAILLLESVSCKKGWDCVPSGRRPNFLDFCQCLFVQMDCDCCLLLPTFYLFHKLEQFLGLVGLRLQTLRRLSTCRHCENRFMWQHHSSPPPLPDQVEPGKASVGDLVWCGVGRAKQAGPCFPFSDFLDERDFQIPWKPDGSRNRRSRSSTGTCNRLACVCRSGLKFKFIEMGMYDPGINDINDSMTYIIYRALMGSSEGHGFPRLFGWRSEEDWPGRRGVRRSQTQTQPIH